MARPDDGHKTEDGAGFDEALPAHRARADRRWRATSVLIGLSLLAVACAAGRRSITQPASAVELAGAGPLAAVERRELAQSEEHAMGIDAALHQHQLAVQAKVHLRLAARRAPKQQLAGGSEDLNFWDLINPTGQSDGAPKEQPAIPVGSSAQADAVMSGGGSVDPEAMMDLERGLKDHEQQDQENNQQAVAQGPTQSAAWDDSASSDGQLSSPQQLSSAGKRARLSGGSQGFVTGSVLKVSADEYHQRMRTDMPSADGKLISPFKWFQAAGQPAAAPKGKPAGRE